MLRNELELFLNDYLKTEEFNDSCPNGLQVEGKKDINRIITGVSASVELFEKAISEKVDAIIVHHGLIWDFERPLYRGGYRERIRLLLQNNINLFAYHLPLDAHPELGNNAQLAKFLDMRNIRPFGDYKGQYIGISGKIAFSSKEECFAKIKKIVKRNLTIFPFGPDNIKNVGIISGAAQKEIKQAVSAGLDLFITGEVSEHIMHYAKEEGIHFVSAGHYATEKFGIIALGNLLKQKFRLNVNFLDIPNPI
jgi:dinuclear metal center YbgI/SA1388 family protein